MKASGTENTVLRVRAVQTDGKRYNPVNHGVSMKKLDESPYMVNLLKPHPTENNAFELLIDADTLIESLEDAGLYDTVAANFRVSGNDLVYDRVKPDGTIIQAGVAISGLFSAESDTFYGSGVPDNGTGNDGDEYLDTTSGIIYQKESGVWVVKKDLNTLDNQIASEVPFDPAGTAFDPGSTDVDKALKEAADRVQDLETFKTSATAELSDHETRIQTEEAISLDHETRISANEAVAHSHANKTLLDTYTQTEADLADAVTKRHSHTNKALLDTYTQSDADITDAISLKHNHPNKALLDSYSQTESDLADAVSLKHSHSNKALLDTYNQTEVDLADAVAKKHVHANASALDNVADNGSILDYLSGNGEYVPIHMTLTGLRAYTGNAIMVTVHYNGTVGQFERDDTDTSSSDNTGTIVLDAKSPTQRRWKRKYDTLDARHFGFGESASTNHTTLAAAINYLGTTASLTGQYGLGRLKIPKGNYEIQGTIDPTVNMIGLVIEGEGRYATNLIFAPTTGVMFQIDTFIFPSFRDLSIFNGTLSGNTFTGHGSSTAICFNLNGSGGGLNLTNRDIQVRYFGHVVKSTSQTAGEDTIIWDNCDMKYNDTVWENSNTQAVTWMFLNCDMKYNKTTIFKNPGTSLQVIGGTYINDCKFIHIDAANYLLNGKADGVKFETYESINGSANPYWIYLENTTPGVTFKFANCSSKTGGFNLSGKYSVRLSGNYNILFDNCQLDGDIDANPNTSSNGSVGRVSFINCKQTQKIVNTLSAGQGNTPTSLSYINSVPYGFNKPINAVFERLTANSLQLSIPGMTRQEVLYYNGTINTTTVSKEFPVYIAPDFIGVIKAAWIRYGDNGNVNATVTVWTDNTKTTQICQFTKPSATSGTKYEELVVTPPTLNNASGSLYMEITTTGNAGVVNIRLVLDLIGI